MNKIDMEKKIIRFIADQKGIDPSELNTNTLLITDGILDSISVLNMVNFLEETYGIEFEAHEVTEENLNTVNQMIEFILAKKN